MNRSKNNTISRRGLLGAGSMAIAAGAFAAAEPQGRLLGDGRRVYGERSAFVNTTLSFGSSALAGSRRLSSYWSVLAVHLALTSPFPPWAVTGQRQPRCSTTFGAECRMSRQVARVPTRRMR